jgi:subtilisin
MMHRWVRVVGWIAPVLVLALVLWHLGPDSASAQAPNIPGGNPQGPPPQVASAAIPDQYIVVLRDNAANPQQVANAIAQQHGLTVSHVYQYALKGLAATIPAQRLAAVRADARVRYVSQDREVQAFGQAQPVGPDGRPGVSAGRPGGGVPPQPPQTLPTGVNRVDADQSSTLAGNGSGDVSVDVAVLDTGISTHTDLNVVGGHNCSGGNPNNSSDGYGHGTHVAGIIGARDNAIGVVGVAPGARLWAVKVLNNQGFGSWSSIVCGIDWVTSRAGTIKVANMSLGGGGSDTGCGTNTDALHDAICNSVNAGVAYIVAAGNSGADSTGFVPAAYDEVITVSALADYDGQPGGLGSLASACRSDSGADDTFAPWSNYGADVDLGAPGVCILSTYNNGGYTTMSGTSMASPHVAGGAALYRVNNPGDSPAQVRVALRTSGELPGAGHTDISGNHPEPVLKLSAY